MHNHHSHASMSYNLEAFRVILRAQSPPRDLEMAVMFYPQSHLKMLWVHNLHPDSVFRAQISLIHFKIVSFKSLKYRPIWDSIKVSASAEIQKTSQDCLSQIHSFDASAGNILSDTLRTLNALKMLLFQVSSYLWCMWCMRCMWCISRLEWLDQCSPAVSHEFKRESQAVAIPRGRKFQRFAFFFDHLHHVSTFRKEKNTNDRNPLGLTINVWSFLLKLSYPNSCSFDPSKS